MAAISLGTALAIGAISAGGSVAKGAIQARAAGKAAKQQAQGAKDAARQMQQGFGTISQLYQPYLQRGASVSNTLGRLTTPGAGARYASPGPPPMGPPPQQGPGTGRALPRMGGMQGPYMMAEGGDVVVDKPTMFIAGEAGPERATFTRNYDMNQQQAGPYRPSSQPPGGGPVPRPMMGGIGMLGAPSGGDIKSKLMAKYGSGRGGPMTGRTMGDPRQGAMAGGPRQFMRGGGGPPQGPPMGGGGWGGAFAQMMPPGMRRPGMPPPGAGGPPQGPPQGAPPMDMRYQAMMANRAQGEAAGQDMSWMDQPGATTPQQWTPMPPQSFGYY